MFADLAGFTALTEAHGDEQAADAATEFCGNVRRLIGEYGAEEVKTIGDAVMIRVNEPKVALNLASAILDEVGAQHGRPSVRVGIHSGPAVERNGDWFGATVNVAARISALAGGDEILLSADTMKALDKSPELGIESVGLRRLKNIPKPIEIYRLAGLDDPRAVDPVCQMTLDPRREMATFTHRGIKYHFCSRECIRAFVDDPDAYAGEFGH